MRHKSVARRVESLGDKVLTIRVRNPRARIEMTTTAKGPVTYDSRRKAHVLPVALGSRTYRLRTSTIESIE